MPLFRLDPRFPELFPDPLQTSGNGPACFGGDLSPQRLIYAYQLGYFPWFSEGEPILWWHPDPRFVLFPAELKVSKSMRPYFNQRKFTVRYDTQFERVMQECKQRFRPGQWGSWITKDLIASYVKLHEMGLAHSVEVYEGEELVGGLYGLALGRVFFGESMFQYRSNASKFGFITLVHRLRERGYRLIDCQQETQHLRSLGGQPITRQQFLDHLEPLGGETTEQGPWG
ncbi:leucyl/phenylalanyl-tRNA--protein transferase [Neolewinella lacunae]|uniref:Leucyl/phenylalanyl-tRNA--protein transferase n=1 Tax=Neolewinella lacunae TaxID=1517758 RepID=A0A923PEJ8_9BACT|nr:leucyl/phenylalanyl-tRNA--protein transferase [Neolewinella lacunae]MBC6992663.1 leucyl/phenylalanyl-tRNA--protein transferase [Neolewinella lacunae]MDN3633543.1 leucyl/phenylalanyl-tRNA--protein transferase [Neolewinella lacunae]